MHDSAFLTPAVAVGQPLYSCVGQHRATSPQTQYKHLDKEKAQSSIINDHNLTIHELIFYKNIFKIYENPSN